MASDVQAPMGFPAKGSDVAAHWIHLLCITAILASILLLINPFRNVVIGDDSNYVRTVQRLSEQGTLKLSPGIGPSFVFQLFWGWLFTVPFGFSIPVVIASIPPLALLGLIAFYWTFIALGTGAVTAFLGTVAVLTSPPYIRLLASFNTDVPFVSLTFIAVLFYVKALKSGGRQFFFLGSMAASFSLLTRQVGIAIAAAIFVALVYRAAITKRIPWKDLAAALLLPLITVSGYVMWIYGVGALTWAQKYNLGYRTWDHIWSLQFPVVFADHLARYCVSTVLLLVPFFSVRQELFITQVKAAARHPFQVGAFLGLALLINKSASPRGIQSWLLVGRGLYHEGIRGMNETWKYLAFLLLLVAGALFIGLARHELGRLLKRLANRTSKVEMVFIGAMILIILISVSFSYKTVGRYLLPIFPFVGLLWLCHNGLQPANARLPIIVIAVSCLVGVWTTRFAYDVDEVKWQEAERLVTSGVQREDIRGSWGWEGWHFWDSCLERMIAEGRETEAKNDCWQTHASTAYKIKLYSVLGQKVAKRHLTDHYMVERLISVKTFGIPAEVAVMVRRPS